MVEWVRAGIKRCLAAAAAVATMAVASVSVAQTGDPDRIYQQEALAHATAIEHAFQSVEARIRVTNANADGLVPPGLWTVAWNGTSDPPDSGWWLADWTVRGLTARYCEGVLAVYAADDELKGVGRDHRTVQVAPTVSGGGRSGLHVITQGSRIYDGARGREDGSLPACMPIPSFTGDRVGLILAVDDPMRTRTGVRWDFEEQDVACPNPSDTGHLTQRRLKRVQATSVENCGPPNCEDLTVQSGGDLGWPASCDVREAELALEPPTLPPDARCTEWFRWSSNCQIVYEPPDDPDPIPVPTITYEDGGVYSWTRPCSCGVGMTGTCTLRYERDTEWRIFVLRPGEPEIRTRIPHRLYGDARFVGRLANCVAIVTPPINPPEDPPVLVPTSGTDSCPDGFQGIATWTQQPGEDRVYDYTGCTPVGPPVTETTTGSQACPSPWSGTVSWSQEPGEARVYDHSACSQSGTEACPVGQIGTVTWTQAWGQPQAFDYSGCTDDPAIQGTSGAEACPSPWSGTATWAQVPGGPQVYDYSGCSQSGTGTCPSGQVGTASWTQVYGGSQVWNFAGCSAEDPNAPDPVYRTQTDAVPQSGACPASYTGTQFWEEIWDVQEVDYGDGDGWQEVSRSYVTTTDRNYGGCTRSGTEACFSGWNGSYSWTQTFGEARQYDYTGCTRSGSGSCQIGYSGSASFTQTWGEDQVWDYSACTEDPTSGSGACPSGFTGTATWTQQPGQSRIWNYSSCSRSFACPAGWTGSANQTGVGASARYDYSGCTRSGTGACQIGYSGTASWTQTWGEDQVWNYGACVQDPTSGTEACAAPWTSGTMSWTQPPGGARVYDISGCCRQAEEDCGQVDDTGERTQTVSICGDGSRTTVRACGGVLVGGEDEPGGIEGDLGGPGHDTGISGDPGYGS